jgi:CheY-like chemotaxis protein
LKELVEESLGILRAALPAMIEIRTSFAPELPLVSCEPDAVRQCLVNLCTNSENAIGRRPGWIEISLDEERIEIATATPDLRPGRYVRLSVKDSGSGMEPKTLRRAFDPFFTTKPAGTGLGLSVIHGIMKSHGGAVTGESEPGKGSTFRLYFPVPRGTGPHAVTADAVGGGNRILYVDDEEALVFLVQRLLSRAGFEVTTSSDPVQALGLFQSDPGRFDALVTDLAMPSMSGFDLARRCLSIRPELPVILTTGYVGRGQTKEASEIGIREVILKPNTADELVDALAGLLRSGKGGPDRG